MDTPSSCDSRVYNINPSGRKKLRGYHKKKSTFFKKGVLHLTSRNQPSTQKQQYVDVQRPCKRHDKDYLDVLTKQTDSNEFSMPAADGSEGSAYCLRPKKCPTTEDNVREETSHPSGRYNVMGDNILVDKSLLLKLINDCTDDHKEAGLCDNLQWDLIDFEPWGVSSSVILTCTSCNFKSSRTKLFEEVNTNGPGRKSATGNLRLQLILQDTPIGPTELQLIFAALGLRVGSLSGMQKASYKASRITEEVATTDMVKWREFTKQVLADRGCNDFDQICAQFDVRYQGHFKSSAKTPGPGAVQATATLVETVTPQKKCLAIDHVNKACPGGSRLKGRGTPIYCGHGGSAQHKGCTATQPVGRGIRECDMAERIAEDVLDTSNLSVTHLATDSDATGKKAFQEVNEKSGKHLPQLTWYKDPSHVSRNMKKQILNHKFHSETFGRKLNGKKWSYKEKLDCRKALALDVPERVAITLRNICQYWKGDVDKIRNNVDTVAGYMMKCYGGDHHSCSSAPLARLACCTGSGRGKCWFTRSSNLIGQGISSLNLSPKDYSFLLSVIQMKLCQEVIDLFSRRENTSRCESINRAISKGCPPNNLFSRTSKGRVCSAIGRQNNSFQDFVHMKFRASHCPLPPDSIGYKIIQKYQRKRELTCESERTKSATTKRRSLLAEHRKDYFGERLKITNEADYHKYQLDLACKHKASALDTIQDSEPTASTSFQTDIENATAASSQLRDVLSKAKAYSMRSISSTRRRQRLQRKAKQQRNKDITAARKKGSESTVKLRNEHSYGRLM